MGFFTDLLGGPGDVDEIGGGFDPALRPYLEEGLSGLQTAYQAGPRVYQGPRVAGFDPAQLQAQSSLLALSTAQPDYYATATQGLQEALGLQRQAATPLTAAEVTRQREILQPTIEAERLAAQRAFERSIRDIGTTAGTAGVGAYGGSRADILRGGAAGELAMTEAQLQGRLTEQALGMAEAERQRQALGATGLAALTGQQLGIGQAGFGEQQERAGLAMGVGGQRQALEQRQIGAEMARFGEADPFSFAQQYLSTIYGAPTRSTQYSQQPSTFQEIMGMGQLAASFVPGAANGGQIVKRNAGGGIASLAMGSQPRTGMRQPIGYDEDGMPIYSDNQVSMAPVSSPMSKLGPTQERANYKPEDSPLRTGAKPLGEMSPAEIKQKADIERIKEGAEFIKAKQDEDKDKDDKGKKLQEAFAAGSSAFEPQIFGGSDAGLANAQANARAKLEQMLASKGRFNTGGGISMLQKGRQVVGAGPQEGYSVREEEEETQREQIKSPMAQQVREEVVETKEPSTFDRILSSVGSGLKSVASLPYEGFKYYATELDPFRDLPQEERMRIGLGILAAQPGLGESPLSTVARGIQDTLQAQELMDLERAKADTESYVSGGPTPFSAFEAAEGNVFSLTELGNPAIEQKSKALMKRAADLSVTDPDYKQLYDPKSSAERAVVATKIYEDLAREYKQSDEYKVQMDPTYTPRVGGGKPFSTPNDSAIDTTDTSNNLSPSPAADPRATAAFRILELERQNKGNN